MAAFDGSLYKSTLSIYLSYEFLSAFHSYYGPVLYYLFIFKINRDIGRKSRFFHTGPAFDAPFGMGKIRIVQIPDSDKSLRICLLFLTQYINVTETQTDTAQQQESRYTASIGCNRAAEMT